MKYLFLLLFVLPFQFISQDLNGLLKIAKDYSSANNHKKAIETYNSAINKAGSNSEALSYIYFSIGDEYRSLKEYKNAIDSFSKSINYYEQSGDYKGVGITQMVISQIFIDQNKGDKALTFLEKSSSNFILSKDFKHYIQANNSIGIIYSNKGFNDKALEYFNKSSEIASKHKFEKELVNIKKLIDQVNENKLADQHQTEAQELEEQATINKLDELSSNVFDLKTKNDQSIKEIENLSAEKRALAYKAKYAEEMKLRVIDSTNHALALKDKEVLLSKLKESEAKAEKEKSKALANKRTTQLFAAIGAVILIAIITGLIFIGYQRKGENLKIVSENNRTIQNQHNKILASIEYAKITQSNMLVDPEIIKSKFNDAFILLQAKDKVSGDFYWYGENDKYNYFVAADCTGHGVPGALLSVYSHSLFDRAIFEKRLEKPSEILNFIKSEIVNKFSTKEDSTPKDSIDLVFLAFHKDNSEVIFCGAKNPLYLVRNDDLIVYKGNRLTVGYNYSSKYTFEEKSISLNKGDKLYCFSDGFADQFSDVLMKKFTYKQFQNLIKITSKYNGEEQKRVLLETFNDWKGTNEQLDDVLVVGITI